MKRARTKVVDREYEDKSTVKGSELAIQYSPVESLKPWPRNARQHDKRQIDKIARSIKTFGFTNPLLINAGNVVVAGHGRLAAAKKLGMTAVPTIRLENLTKNQIAAYVIADNRLAELASWDKAILAIELQNLQMDTEFDVGSIGFEVGEIDLIIEEAKKTSDDKDDDVVIDETAVPVTQPGDCWVLGRHRILCGNALCDDSFKTLLDRRRANLAFIDPPYNVAIDGHASGNGSTAHRDFLMGSGELSEMEFLSFLRTSLRLLARHSAPESIHFVCIDWRHIDQLVSAGKEVYDALLNVCVWTKGAAGMGSLYRSAHEFISVFRCGKGRHRNNILLGKFGRNRTNVWAYPSANTFSRQGDEGNLLALHPTVKPVALVADAILDCSARNDLVLDSFLGSGSTLIACERVGRTCCGLELNPVYIDVTVRRWQRYSGDRAVHATTGKYFDDIANDKEGANVR